jgi:hypothetical protein
VPVNRYVVLDQDRRALDTGTDDSDEGCGEDTEERDESPEGKLAPFSRVGDLNVSPCSNIVMEGFTKMLKMATIRPHQTPQIELEERDRSASSPAKTCDPARPIAYCFSFTYET